MVNEAAVKGRKEGRRKVGGKKDREDISGGWEYVRMRGRGAMRQYRRAAATTRDKRTKRERTTLFTQLMTTPRCTSPPPLTPPHSHSPSPSPLTLPSFSPFQNLSFPCLIPDAPCPPYLLYLRSLKPLYFLLPSSSSIHTPLPPLAGTHPSLRHAVGAQRHHQSTPATSTNGCVVVTRGGRGKEGSRGQAG